MSAQVNLNIEELKDFLKHIIRNNKHLQDTGKVPTAVNIEGPAGLGKTSAAIQLTEELNYNLVRVNLAQIEELVERGADQVDVVMPMNSILDDDMSAVEQEIDALSEIKSRNPLCLIINTPWLNHDQLMNTVQRVHTTQQFIIRTSTGYGMTTDLNVVESLKNEFGASLKIIVSGGCDTTQSGLDFIHAGAEGIYVNDLFSYIEGFLTLNAFQESQRESN